MKSVSTDALAHEVARVAKLNDRERLQDPWCQMLLAQTGAKRLFGSKQNHLPGKIAQLSYIAMVLRCLSEQGHEEGGDVTFLPIAPKQGSVIRQSASSLRDALDETGQNKALGIDEVFERKLDGLCDVESAICGPVRSLKGNPQRRLFIWLVAEACYKAFTFFHVDAITEIVALRWDEIENRAVSRELTKERKSVIAGKVDGVLRAESSSRFASTLAIGRASASAIGTRPVEATLSTQLLSVRNAISVLSGKDAKEFFLAHFDQALYEYSLVRERQ